MLAAVARLSSNGLANCRNYTNVIWQHNPLIPLHGSRGGISLEQREHFQSDKYVIFWSVTPSLQPKSENLPKLATAPCKDFDADTTTRQSTGEMLHVDQMFSSFCSIAAQSEINWW